MDKSGGKQCLLSWSSCKPKVFTHVLMCDTGQSNCLLPGCASFTWDLGRGPLANSHSASDPMNKSKEVCLCEPGLEAMLGASCVLPPFFLCSFLQVETSLTSTSTTGHQPQLQWNPRALTSFKYGIENWLGSEPLICCSSKGIHVTSYHQSFYSKNLSYCKTTTTKLHSLLGHNLQLQCHQSGHFQRGNSRLFCILQMWHNSQNNICLLWANKVIPSFAFVGIGINSTIIYKLRGSSVESGCWVSRV